MQQALNAICVREHLNTVDFLLSTSSKTTEAEYWAKQRGQAALDAKNEAIIHLLPEYQDRRQSCL